MVKVYNLESYKGTGKEVANQFEIYTDDGRYFQSYSTMVAKIDNSGQVFINRRYYDSGWISRTTCNYLRQFLNVSDSKKEIEKKITNGIYQLVDLG